MSNSIANIITNGYLVLPDVRKYVDYLCFNDICDPRTPTLYVGYTKTKELFFPELDILNNEIEDGEGCKRWTFSKDEHMNDYFTGLSSFINNAPRLYFQSYTYTPYHTSFCKQYGYHNFIRTLKDGQYSTYRNKRSLYILQDRQIIGFDMHYMFYFEPDTINVLMDHLRCGANKMIDDMDGELLKYYSMEFEDYSEIIEKYIITLEQ